jgi:hypothetical protein
MPPSDVCTIFSLHDEVLELVAGHLELEELINLCRASTRFRDFVREAEGVWKSLSSQTFGPAPLAESSWRDQFQIRYAAMLVQRAHGE